MNNETIDLLRTIIALMVDNCVDMVRCGDIEIHKSHHSPKQVENKEPENQTEQINELLFHGSVPDWAKEITDPSVFVRDPFERR